MQNFTFHTINNISEAKTNKVNLLNCWQEDIEIKFGTATATSGKYAFQSIKLACNALKKEEVNVLVTAPINKASIQKEISGFVGHTEFLQGNFEGEALMIMISEVMKIAFVTGHIPLSEVKTAINIENIISSEIPNS